MHKDVKRSLVAWPLAVSLMTIALAWFAMQPGGVSKLSWAKWLGVDAGSIVTSIATDSPHAGLATRANESTPHPQSSERVAQSAKEFNRVNPNGIREELAGIDAWTDVSFEIQQPAALGIPAPSLGRHSDLFGFDDMALNQAGTSINVTQPGGRQDATIERGTPIADTNWKDEKVGDQPVHEEIVIRLDPQIFFADDSPLSDRQLDHRFQSVSSRSLGRATTTPPPSPAYEAPAASVADFALGNVQSGDSIGIDRPVNQSESAVNDHRRSVPPNVPTRSRQESGTIDRPSENNRNLTPARSATWPVTHQLLKQLDTLETIASQNLPSSHLTGAKLGSKDSPSSDDLLEWSASVRKTLDQLHESNRLGDEKVEQLLAELRQAQRYASETAESLISRSQRVAWLQAAFAVERRLAVWDPIYQINSGDFTDPHHVGDELEDVTESIDRLEQILPQTGDASGWTRFMMLNDLRKAFETGDGRDRREASQTFLSRISWPNLAPMHREWIAQESVQNVADSVRPWASGAIDYSSLLHQIERAESNAIHLVTAEIAQSMQILRNSGYAHANELARNLDVHYRNANVRFSISEDLLQNLLPQIPTRDVPVRTTLLGSRVTGVSRVESELRIKLVPSPSTWQFTLEALGNVSTRSVGRRGPAAVRTSSVNPYEAETAITIKPTDVQLGNASVDVGGRARLRGINTTYDSWPLVGSLVQNIAQNEYFEQASLANRIGRRRIQTQIGDEIDRTIGEKAELASSQFSKTILGPLTELKLEPRVIDMSSTSSRLIARYRMAGTWQLAAMTPRPRALAGNLFSVQMHQSAVNNTLEQLVPQNRAMPIHEVLKNCFDLLGINPSNIPEDLPDDASIQFAKHRPITVEIEDGKVWITMRVIRLERGKGTQLRNFIVRAAYKPEINGMNATLVRDGHLSISGPRMSMRQRFPVRAVFNKVLSPNRPLTLLTTEMLARSVPENTAISQFELRDGWIGISIGKQTEHHSVATRPAGIR